MVRMQLNIGEFVLRQKQNIDKQSSMLILDFVRINFDRFTNWFKYQEFSDSNWVKTTGYW